MKPSDDFEVVLRRRIENYKATEDQVADRIQELQGELVAMRERREAAERLYRAEYGSGEPPGQSTERTGTQAEFPLVIPHRPAAGSSLAGLSWEAAILRVLQHEGGPLHVKEIWSRLASGGFRTVARDPLRSIVAVSVRSRKIARTGPNTYVASNGTAASTGAESGVGNQVGC